MDETYHVIILDDDNELGLMLKEYLQNAGAGEVTYVSSESEFWQALALREYDILFLDYKLDSTTGLDVLARMGQAGISLPTVMMTGEGSEHIAARAIQSGAMDYLIKGQVAFSALPALVVKAARLREMQRAMQRYLEQIRFQARLLDAMREAVVVWELDGVISYWNHPAEELYGASAAERMGQRADEVYFPFFDPPIVPTGPALRDHAPFERRFQRPGGEWIWVSAQITVLAGESEEAGTSSGAMSVGRDITERKAMETRLLDVQARLAQDARLRSIGELAAGVAHQISNPLTTIIAEAQMLDQRLPRVDPGRESTGAIIQAGWRAQEVINELMKFSQPAQGQSGPVEVNETIQKALLLVSAHIQAAGVNLHVALQPDLPVITGSARRLTDLWVNLFLLARSSFVSGSRNSLRVSSRAEDSGDILVEVRDDGIPIPAAQYDTIFEPQLIPTGSGRGTGMELSLCREIVRQHHGQIAISGDGTDTVFTIHLPAAAES